MSVQDRNKAWGYALFADDIRVEVGGKTSLMGIYQADMIFADNIPLPFIVSKFVIQVMYFELIGSIEGDFSIKVTYGKDNTLLVEVPVIRKELRAPEGARQALAEDLVEDAERIFHMRMPVVLSPFVIAETGRVRIRAHYADGSILKLGSIAITQIPERDFQAMSGIPPTQ